MGSRQYFFNPDLPIMKKFSRLICWQRHTKLPIIMKGVQSIEDVELCVKYGAQGVMLVSTAVLHIFTSSFSFLSAQLSQ